MHYADSRYAQESADSAFVFIHGFSIDHLIMIHIVLCMVNIIF